MSDGGTAPEWLDWGIALAQLGRYEEALEAFNKAIEYSGRVTSSIYIFLAAFTIRQGMFRRR